MTDERTDEINKEYLKNVVDRTCNFIQFVDKIVTDMVVRAHCKDPAYRLNEWHTVLLQNVVGLLHVHQTNKVLRYNVVETLSRLRMLKDIPPSYHFNLELDANNQRLKHDLERYIAISAEYLARIALYIRDTLTYEHVYRVYVDNLTKLIQ